MRTVYQVLLGALLFGAVGVYPVSATEEFLRLNLAYRQALDQAEDQLMAKQGQLVKQSADALDQLGAGFRERGNTGYYLECRRVADRMRRDSYHTLDPADLSCPDIRSQLSRLEQGIGVLEQERCARVHRIGTVMISQLEGMVADLQASGNSDLVREARATQAEIRSNPDYLLIENQMAMNQQAASIRRQRASLIPTPTPVPALPVTTRPMLELEISKKYMSRHAHNGDYDDQRQDVCFKVELRSRELVKNYGPLEVKVWGVGREVTSRKVYKNLLVETMNVKELPRGKTEELVTKVVKTTYDDNRAAQYGFKFYGYLCTITEKETGRVLCTKVTPSQLERNMKTIQAEGEGQEFTL